MWQERFGHLDLGRWGVPAPAGCVHCGGCHTLVALPSLLQVSQSPRTTIPTPARAARGSWLAHPGAGRGCEDGWGEGLRAPPHTSDPFPTCISSVPASGVCFQPFQMDPSTVVTWLGQGGSPSCWGFMGAPAAGCVRVAKHCPLLLPLLFFILQMGQSASSQSCSWLVILEWAEDAKLGGERV